MSEETSKRANAYKNHVCSNCGEPLRKNHLDGVIKGKRLRFCSFKCHDSWVDSKDKSQNER